MKENNKIFKILGIVLLVVIALTWLIPGAQFDGKAITVGDTVSPAGLWNVLAYLMDFSFFMLSGLFLLVVAGFYGVMNKTDVYQNVVRKIAKFMKGKELVFIAFSILFFGGITAVTGLILPLFVLVPFFISIILVMNFDKLTAISATVLASVIGLIGGLFGYNNAYAFLQNVGIENVYTNILGRGLVLALGLIALFGYIVYHAKVNKLPKKTALKENEDLFLVKESKTKQKAWPLIVIGLVVSLIVIVAPTPSWDILGYKGFGEFYNKMIEFKVNGYPLFANLLGNGSIQAFGSWTVNDLIILLVIASLVVALIYKVKLSEALVAFTEAAKKMVPAMLIVWLIYLIVIIAAKHPFYVTSVDYLFSIVKSFNIGTIALASTVSGALFAEGMYAAQFTLPAANLAYSSQAALMAVTSQMFSALSLIFAPTSIMLVVSLYYLDVPYTKWLKYVWKFLIVMLVIVTAVILLIAFKVI